MDLWFRPLWHLTQSVTLKNGIGVGSSRLESVVISTGCEINACSPFSLVSDLVVWPIPLRADVGKSGTKAFVAGERSSTWY